MQNKKFNMKRHKNQNDAFQPALDDPEKVTVPEQGSTDSGNWSDYEDLPDEGNPDDTGLEYIDLMSNQDENALFSDSGPETLPADKAYFYASGPETLPNEEVHFSDPEPKTLAYEEDGETAPDAEPEPAGDTKKKRGLFRRNRRSGRIRRRNQNRTNQASAGTELPSTEQLSDELKRERYKIRYHATIRSTIFILITVAAAAILAATFLFPFFRIYGTSMNPTLEESDVVMGIKTDKMETGDLIAFYYNNKILVKRVIATSGQWVDIDEDGNVYVDGEMIDEPYLSEKAKGSCDIELPYQVPDESVFVMGDHREVSIDSRVSAIGCVKQDQVAGKLLLRIWPLNRFGLVR